MISVIISSADQHLLTAVSLNIEQTIGVPFEIISTENHLGKKGICEIYNTSASTAKYELLCFIHEDLSIKTLGWGHMVLAKFKRFPDLGVLGVAGSAYKTFAPSGWDVEGDEGLVRYLHYIQSYKTSNKPAELISCNANCTPTAPVVAVDGMWFCTLKSIVKRQPFDQDLLKGFHGYDLDFCLSLYPKYKVMVTFDVLMKHYSEGSFNQKWFGEIIKVHRKWQHLLPLQTKEVSQIHKNIFEKRALKKTSKYYLASGYSKEYVLQQLWEYQCSGKIGFYLFLKLAFYVLKENKRTSI